MTAGALTLAPAPATAAPVPFACANSGLLTQASTVTEVNLVTGATTSGPTLPVNVNGAGYNRFDGQIYVWDYVNQGIGRFDAAGTYQPLGLPPGMAVLNWNMGDVDADGYLWLGTSGGTTNWAKIDVRPSSATFGQMVASGAATRPASVRGPGADWAWVPGHTGKLYATAPAASEPTHAVLIEFDMAASTWTVLGDLGPFVSSGQWATGAVYADADGFLYGEDNTTGTIIRIDIDTVTASVFAVGPPSTVNDGASCAQVSLAVDFGDAPASYSVTLAQDGPRHALDDFAADSADLMIGTSVTSESDPAGVDTDLDDAFAANPVLVSGAALPLAVPVTNDTAADAVLVAWLDVDGSGTFDPSEQTAPVTVPANSGTTTVSVTLPALTRSESWLRLRLLPATAPIGPTGSAAAGEVEDWHVTTKLDDGTPGIDPSVAAVLVGAAGLVFGGRRSRRRRPA